MTERTRWIARALVRLCPQLTLCLAFLAAAGCAPQALDRGTFWLVRKYGTTDAHVRTVGTMPFLRLNEYLLDRLTNVAGEPDVDSARTSLEQTLSACHQLAIESLANEIDRLPPQAVEQAWKTYYTQEALPFEPHAELRKRILAMIKPGWESLRKEVREASKLSEIDAIAQTILRQVNPSVKDRHGGGPLLALVMATTHKPKGPLDLGGLSVDVYQPDPESFDAVGTNGSSEPVGAWRLLTQFAPRIVQERQGDARYAPTADQIGRVGLTGAYDALQVEIDTAAPRVYAYAQPTIINGVPHTQLVYTYWFPERPALKLGDPEAGAIDGATFRITLDRYDRPAIFETILNCGCFHRCYVSTELEAAAIRAFGSPLEGKSYSVARHMKGAPDWEVAQSIAVPDGTGALLTIFSRAGYHAIVSISFDDAPLQSRTVLDNRTYKLAPYAELEFLPTTYGHGSMFGPDGLVHRAGRVEGWLLAGTGMLSAGQPRQRGTQRICWDQYDFDEAHLIERCLRLPPEF